MSLEIETYSLDPRPSTGGSPPRLVPRTVVDATQGGAVIHRSAGARAETVWPWRCDWLDATPKVASLYEFTVLTSDVSTLDVDEAAAIKIPVAAGGFAGVTAVQIAIQEIAAAGFVSIEVWDDDGAGDPGNKVGVLGTIDADDIVPIAPAAYALMTIWSDIAWPLLTPGGWLVVNGAGLTAGSISLWGRAAPLHADFMGSNYTALGGWVPHKKPPALWVWQGGPFLVLRGFSQAYCHDGGTGPTVWHVKDANGMIYEALLLDVTGTYGLEAPSVDEKALVKNVSVDVLLLRAIADQDLVTP